MTKAQRILKLAHEIHQADMERLAQLIWSDKDLICEALRFATQADALDEGDSEIDDGSYTGDPRLARTVRMPAQPPTARMPPIELLRVVIADGFSNGNQQYEEYTADQQRRFDDAARAVAALSVPPVDQARDAVIEECAKIADGWIERFGRGSIEYVSATEYATDAVQDIADAIRALSSDVKKS